MDGWIEQPDKGFLGHIGPVLRDADPGAHRYAMMMDGRHANWRGVAQGGVIMTLADRAMGATARIDNPAVRTATAQLNVNFIAGARLGAPVVAECREIHRTRSLIFMQSELSQEGGLVATATGVWKLLAPRPETTAVREAEGAGETVPPGIEWRVIEDEGFLAHVGPMLAHCDGGDFYAFQPDDRHRNRRGVVQGGMLMTLADRGMGWTARAGDAATAPATVQLDVSFVAPARIGRIVALQCSVSRRARSLVFVQGVLSQDGVTVATASGIWKPVPLAK